MRKNPENSDNPTSMEKFLGRTTAVSAAILAAGLSAVYLSGDVELSPDCVEFIEEAQDDETMAFCATDTIGYRSTLLSTGGLVTAIASAGIAATSFSSQREIRRAREA